MPDDAWILTGLLMDRGVEPFCDGDGCYHASVPMPGGGVETHKFKSERLRYIVGALFSHEMQRTPTRGVIAGALQHLGEIATFVPKRTAHTRFARMPDGRILVHLAGGSGRAIELRPGGWDIVGGLPVWFQEHPHMEALPAPVRGGDPRLLLELMNFGEDDGLLALAWLAFAMVVGLPHAILLLCGIAGALKTTIAKMMRRMLDPSAGDIVNCALTTRQLALAMRQHALPLFDNVGAISPRVADFFCGAATGSGFSARRLFTDDELIVFRYFRPLVITAINPPATSSDFLDRCACFDLRRIQDTHRLREAVVWSEFEQRRPEILGGLLDAAATALRLMGSLQIALLPRMADFAFFGEAYCRALGYAAGRFMEAYWRNIEELAWYAIEASPVAIAAVNFTEHRDVWRGTPTDLRRLLATYSEDHDRGEWPKDAASLSKEIRKLSGALSKVGVDVESLPRTADPHRRERQIQIRWVGSCSARWRNAATEAGHSGQDRGSTADRSARMRRRDLVSRPTKPVLFLPPHGPQGEA